jgi:translocation and assembly module TamB
VDLTPPFNARITTQLNSLVLTDKLLYETTLNGQIAMTGALAGNSSLAGQINFAETNINLAAASGAVGAAPIPEIQHVDESRAGFVTRERAQLVVKEEGSKSDSRIALDVSLVAPKAVFVRGRGVNAELGGRIVIGGTTTSVVPSGQIDLIRGTFDILGRRLQLTKGIVSLQGDLKPYIEFESSASTSDGTATIEIAGPLDSPEVDVFSDPERPAEEALAMLLFGNRFSEISPFLIAQMAASLAQLSGAGGDATKGLRESTGLDTVDIGATEGGAGRLGAGAYLSDNLYTDFTVNTEGDTEVNLNLDVTDNFSIKGTVDGKGETGIGVFFARDY